VSAIAGLVAAFGVLWLGLATVAARRQPRPAPSRPGEGSPPSGAPDRAAIERRRVRWGYRGGLGVWAVAWTPLALLAFFASAGADPSTLVWAVVVSGTVGAAVAVPFHGAARSRLQKLYGFTAEGLFTWPVPEAPAPGLDRVQKAASFAYASWITLGAAVLLLLIGLAVGPGSVDGSGSNAFLPSQVGIVLALIVVLFGVLRGLYHYNVARAASAPSSATVDGASQPSSEGAALLRTQLGAALLPWNPFVGLLLGVALGSFLRWSPYGFVWAFLPVTYLGLALLSGCFGSTAWSSGSVAPPSPTVPNPSAPAPA